MSLPPERISIKRRRQDDPVETLYLELGSAHDKKRRFTDFCFQRLQQGHILPQRIRPSSPQPIEVQRSLSSHTPARIPAVRATQPGDEIKETLRLKAAHRTRLKDLEKENIGTKGDADITILTSSNKLTTTTTNVSERLDHARSFYLSRDTQHSLCPDQRGGIRKANLTKKSRVAIFVERQIVKSENSKKSSESVLLASGIVELHGNDDDRTGSQHTDINVDAPASAKRSKAETFVQPPAHLEKTGHSIRDPPSTWDHTSDQLADELAALALELDPDSMNKSSAEGMSDHVGVDQYANAVPSDPVSDDEYTYDTYLRLPSDQLSDLPLSRNELTRHVGILVIDEEDEELWQTYAESEEDTEWDDEDGDSNAEDNPANDYPEDEVNSDDEFGFNAYHYRKYASDEEEYDMDHDS